MTQANTQSSNKFDSSMVFTIKNTIGVGKINFRILFLKALELPTFRMLWSRLFHSITAVGKRIFEKVMFCFEEGYLLSISSGVRRMS